MEVPMVSARGDADVRALGVEPRRMAEVLGIVSREVGEPRESSEMRRATVRASRSAPPSAAGRSTSRATTSSSGRRPSCSRRPSCRRSCSAACACGSTEPLDPEWLAGVARILPIWAGWWGTAPNSRRGARSAPSVGWRRTSRVPSALACASAAASTRSTPCSARARPIDDLVFAHGYRHPARRRAPVRRRRGVGARGRRPATGARALVVRTNLRRRRPFKGAGWARTHGGALAALGHACSGELGEILISVGVPASQRRRLRARPGTPTRLVVVAARASPTSARSSQPRRQDARGDRRAAGAPPPPGLLGEPGADRATAASARSASGR